MSEADALRTARLQFGNFTTQVERTRDMDIHDWLESSVRNVRYALRGLAKTPAFTATVILTLALAHWSEQRGLLRHLCRAASAVAIPQRRPAREVVSSASQGSPAVCRAGPSGRLEPSQRHPAGHHRLLLGRRLGTLRRTSRKTRARLGRAALSSSHGRRSIPGARLRSARGAIWRTECRVNQRPSMAPPFRRQPKRNRQDPPHRHHRVANRRHHARVVSLSRPRCRPLVPQSRGRSFCAEQGIDVVHRHRPPEARCDARTCARQSEQRTSEPRAGNMRRPTRRSGR